MSSALVRRRLLRVCAVSLACALAAGLFTYRRSRESGGPAPASPQAPAAAVSLEAQRREWSPGAWYRYTLTSSHTVSVRSMPGAQQQPPMRFQLKGAWLLGVCSASAEAAEVRVAFSPSDFSVDMGGEQPLAPEVRRQLLEALSTPFFLTLDRAGAVRLIHFEHWVDGLVQGLLRSVVASSQVVLPSPASPSWESSEEDSSGRYLARYTLQPPLQVEKVKLRYTHLVGEEGVQPVEPGISAEVSSHTTLALAREDLWLESLQGEETLLLDPGKDMPAPRAHTQVELRLVERGLDRSLLTAFAERQSALLSLPLASAQLALDQEPRDQYRRVLAGRTLRDFMQSLRSLPAERKARSNTLNDVLFGLHALFVLEPATAAQVPALLHTGLDPAAAGVLINSLAAATTPEALRALAQTMEDTTLPLQMRANAADAMGGAEAPDQESISSLWRLAQSPEPELSETAILSLGSAAMYLQKTDSRAADALVDRLSKALAMAQGEAAQDLWLGALGNSRLPRALPAIQAFLTVPSAELRGSAAQALRFMPAPEADKLLSQLLLSDSSLEVRRAAVFAASFRPLEPLLPALERALRSDSEAAVRKAVVELLGSHASTSPQARLLLAWSQQNDKEDSVRREAAKALSSLPSSP